MPNRTRYRIIFPVWELVLKHKMDKDNLPDNMELLPQDFPWGPYVAVYLTEEEYKERQDQIFPSEPLTGTLGVWDHDWMEAFDLL